MLEIRKCEYGKGLFALQNIKKDTIIIKNHFILVPYKELTGIVGKYVFDKSNRNAALVLGEISFVNHNKKPNAIVQMDARNKTCSLISIKTILENEQIFIDYGYAKCVQPSWYK